MSYIVYLESQQGVVKIITREVWESWGSPITSDAIYYDEFSNKQDAECLIQELRLIHSIIDL